MLAERDLARTVDRLADRETADDAPADQAVDRPARRRIEAIADGAARWSQGAPTDADRSALIAVARRLATRPGLAGTGIEMLTALGRLRNLDTVADLCADRPVLTFRARQKVDEAGGYGTSHEPEILRATATRLAERGDLAGGLLALSVIVYGTRYGWTSPWRELLTVLRRHPDIDVREEAFSCDMTT
jgi:hypothetical protein